MSSPREQGAHSPRLEAVIQVGNTTAVFHSFCHVFFNRLFLTEEMQTFSVLLYFVKEIE